VLRVDLLRHRKLHQDAVDLGIGVERVYQGQKLGLARVRGETMLDAAQARFDGRLALVAHIDLAGGIVADQHDGEAWHDAMRRLELRDDPCDLAPQRRRMKLAVDYFCISHGRKASSSLGASGAESPATSLTPSASAVNGTRSATQSSQNR
jgi:hypothetical protein